MQIATLNVQNMRLLKAGDTPYLHGAWDSDDPESQACDPIDRRLTAALLAEVDADVVALQEVFDLATLEYFHDTYLRKAGMEYPHRVCLPGNDGRGLDVALLSRRPVVGVKSHAAVTPADLSLEVPDGVDPAQPIFRRDCLRVTVGELTLFVVHFKSNYPDRAVAWRTRRLEAQALRTIVERSFDRPDEALWLIAGDLNEPDGNMGAARAIHPLEDGFSVDLLQRIPEAERWTYFDVHSGRYHCPDALLASDALGRRWPDAVPMILRKGLGREAARFDGARFEDVGEHRPHASDHAAVFIDLKGL